MTATLRTPKTSTQTQKWVYSFGGGTADGDASMKNLLGGKGANLAEMSRIGLPVPPGFILSTEVCTYFYQNNNSYPQSLKDDAAAALAGLEKIMGMRFGDPSNPLLLSIRSGARVSMPGMMDTVLNLGLNDKTVEGLATKGGDPRFAWDSYRRFIQMYSDVVLDVEHHLFEDVLDSYKRDEKITLDTQVSAEGWKEIVAGYKKIIQDETGGPFPQDPLEQLWGAIGAVFNSWMTPRAVTYRKINNIPESWGTAVNVQVMVFGNMGEDCATGVAFTRNPSTGENAFYGEYLINAQGEDVVAGIRTPQQLTIKGKQAQKSTLPSMEETMPSVYQELDAIRHKLEKHYREMEDIEFTIQRGKLYMLQTRTGKRTAQAALRIAVEMAEEGLITTEEAVRRIVPEALEQILHPTLDPKAARDVLTRGLPASPGAASGEIVFNADDAEEKAKNGRNVILCRVETSPEDIHGMHAANGILTSRGGMTSHAAVVARGMGRPCVAGAGEIAIDYKTGMLNVHGVSFKAGDVITIDGSTGDVIRGLVPTVQPELSGHFQTLMGWADSFRRMKVRANAETPLDARTARGFGAEGIGLCRTEHMFFDAARILRVRQMILAETVAEREAALSHLEPMQKADFAELFSIMKGLPVTIRLLDPPLHEFLPHEDKEIAEVAESLRLSADKVRQRVERLKESNPMLGHRGCRLGVVYPEIYRTQVEAIFDAACDVAEKSGETVVPEIMVPLVATRRELDILKLMIDETAGRIFSARKRTIPYTVGTMIELPRAALRAGEIAEAAEFFSFGTNDLTQTTFGISRDDAGMFLPAYQEKGILERDPFASLDIDGVGELISIAVERGRKAKPGLKMGVCGEHGGDPKSISFFEGAGLDYVSCSPYRVPTARLAAAQASLLKKK